MQALSHKLIGDEAVTLDDMGEGCLVLSQRNDDGRMERVVVSLGQLQQAVEVLTPRYGMEGVRGAT
jgi:hypothetical protein